MRSKFVKLIVFILSGMLLLGGCSKKTKIGFLMDVSTTGRWLEDKALFIQSVESEGAKVIFKASEGDSEKQYQMAEDILNRGVDVLVIVPTDQHAAAKIVELANKYEVPVISYDRMIKDCDLDFYVSFDSEKVGELQADYITHVCPEGNYVILKGPITDNNTFLLQEGQQIVLRPLLDSGKITVVYENFVDFWHPDEAYRLMTECLQNCPKIDAILASNDQLAEGAIKALKEAGVTKMPYISGQDAEDNAINRIKKGEQTMTVKKPIENLADKVAEIALKLADDEEVTTPVSFNNNFKQVPSILLEPEIIDE
jgi:D-xylose ABC transporter substrate-binding protein